MTARGEMVRKGVPGQSGEERNQLEATREKQKENEGERRERKRKKSTSSNRSCSRRCRTRRVRASCRPASPPHRLHLRSSHSFRPTGS